MLFQIYINTLSKQMVKYMPSSVNERALEVIRKRLWGYTDVWGSAQSNPTVTYGLVPLLLKPNVTTSHLPTSTPACAKEACQHSSCQQRPCCHVKYFHEELFMTWVWDEACAVLLHFSSTPISVSLPAIQIHPEALKH